MLRAAGNCQEYTSLIIQYRRNDSRVPPFRGCVVSAAAVYLTDLSMGTSHERRVRETFQAGGPPSGATVCR